MQTHCMCHPSTKGPDHSETKSLESVAVKYCNHITWHRAVVLSLALFATTNRSLHCAPGSHARGRTRRSIQQQPAGNHPNPDWQNRQSGRQLVLAPTMQWTFHRSQQPRLARLSTRKSAAGLLGCLLQWGKKQEWLDCICVNCVLCKHVQRKPLKAFTSGKPKQFFNIQIGASNIETHHATERSGKSPGA